MLSVTRPVHQTDRTPYAKNDGNFNDKKEYDRWNNVIYRGWKKLISKKHRKNKDRK